MKVITFSKKVTVFTTHGEHKSELSVNPGERLIFDNDNALTIQQSPGSATYILEVTDLEPLLRERPRTSGAWKKKRVLFYRNRGLGDQLIASALPRFFREILGAEAFVLSDKVHEPIWAYNAFIGGVPLSVPMHIDAVWRAETKIGRARPFFDAAFFFESASEWDNDGEQPNIYDRLFGMAGIEPERVPAKFKRPTFALTSDDITRRLDWLKHVGAATGRDLAKSGYIFLQLRGTNKVRSLPAALVEKILLVANEAAQRRGLTILVGDSKPFAHDLTQLIARTPNALNVATAINSLRMFAAIVGGSTCVIGPDSSALHIAAAFEVPALGFWGPFSPESRTFYYPNQKHIFHSELCLNAPCYNFLPELPFNKCPRGQAQTHCEVFNGATTEEIAEALEELLPALPHKTIIKARTLALPVMEPVDARG